MPIPAPPMKMTCRACGWHRVYAQHGDGSILPGECVACGRTDLLRTVAGLLDGPAVLLGAALRLFRDLARTKRY